LLSPKNFEMDEEVVRCPPKTSLRATYPSNKSMDADRGELCQLMAVTWVAVGEGGAALGNAGPWALGDSTAGNNRIWELLAGSVDTLKTEMKVFSTFHQPGKQTSFHREQQGRGEGRPQWDPHGFREGGRSQGWREVLVN
jgi:hypothetical protein